MVHAFRKTVLGLAILLGACATGPATGPDARAPMIGPTQRLALPRPADLGRSVEAAQLITARRGGDTFVFEGHVSVTPERFTLVGLDTLGRRAMTVTWTDAGVEVETAPWLPDGVRPGAMLADLVVLYWPDAVVRKALAPAGAELAADATSRTVSADGQDLLRARYGWTVGGPWTGTLTYANLAWGYEIEVQSQEQGP
ncbi:DUF3261 domain-containing protein [Azospirillum canadense]|uniref:DUF3261 domain-containing protein n=1 Tax=Azospirillum canadense TaxID=403962 RepID=UPI002226EF20|nr:DUF3261 domain-containing protein [Azospirillum canadense]MCW2236400.1 hypothetical protein [Azospirillum canadense]